MQNFSDHPRPDFARNRWVLLNGSWRFKADPDNIGLHHQWFQPGNVIFDQKIVVPFSWETPASGVNQQWLPVGWYQREITAPEQWWDSRISLNFGAVHYYCQVWVNGKFVGEHSGGYLPFRFDITDLLQDYKAILVVRVEAPVDKRFIPHGKQRSQPPDDYDDCAFTASSGIWQSVWLEACPSTCIDRVSIRPNDPLAGFQAQLFLSGQNLNRATLRVSVDGVPNQEIPISGRKTMPVSIPIAQPVLWSPQNPHLYSFTFELISPDGVDQIHSYSGLRKIEIKDGRFYLNNQPLYLRGVLDQGYWPETGYTAPHDEALRRDVELALAAGYNLVRKHLKFEDPRWLYWADRLGLLVWEEPPCVGRFSVESMAVFEAQLPLMVQRDGNHPCIIIWGIFNEEWGLDWQVAEDPVRQQAVAHCYYLLKTLDPDRPIVDNSGWWHVVTDILDWHYYDEDMSGWQETTASLARGIDSYYGHRLSDSRWYDTQLWVPGYERAGKPLINGEYGGGRPGNQGWLLRWQTQNLRQYAIFQGYIYTELYDVEHEIVGIYTAKRKLKDFGFHPTMVNAETVLCFDLTPVKPGLDLVSSNGVVELKIQVAHHRDKAIHGRLLWAWGKAVAREDLPQHPEGIPIDVAPFSISDPVNLMLVVPEEHKTVRLFFYLVDEQNRIMAESFLDVCSSRA